MNAEFPDKLQFLFEPHRYKVAWGGRGGAKSWGMARALLIIGAQKPLRVLCARETQKSILDSVHKLLCNQIVDLGLGDSYEILKSSIRGKNGTEFIFAGLKHNINNIKSVESCDVVWVEEAQSVTKASWQVLIPTIRKKDSEIWVSFNPDLVTDDTYKRFVLSPPPGAAVVRIGYRDNPWFPEVLRAEAEHLRKRDLDAYQHIWEGCCISVLAGAIYANELRLVDKEERITRVPHDATKPVQTFWDLGYGDSTAIWFVQVFPFEYRIIDYLDGNQQPLSYYLKVLQDKPYLYGTDYLPHDAKPKQFGTGKSIQELMQAAGRKTQIVPPLSVADGINAARSIFGQCYFDGEKCADGLQALRHYRYGEVEKNGTSTRAPIHDWSSHAGDAWRYFAVGVQPQERDENEPEEDEFGNGRFGVYGSNDGGGGGGWMR
jgi:phage terminase large subunit